MSLSWDSVCIKYLMFIFNLLFVITGIIILTVGATIKAYYSQYELFLDDTYFSTSNLLIAIGTIIFLIAFFGCCGAVKESFCMTITFSSLLILVFVLELAAGISGYVLKGKTSEFLQGRLMESLNEYKVHADNITNTWDLVQQTFNCCGVNGPDDWQNMTNATNKQLPLSCCKIPSGAIGNFTCDFSNNATVHQMGCQTVFGDFISSHAYTLGAVGLGFAIVQALGIVFSCRLSRQIKITYENM